MDNLLASNTNPLKNVFEWPDYFVFLIMLIVCIGIGVYFGFFHVSKNVNDYLVGGNNMAVWPVAVSLVVSYLSGISLMGIPTDVYVYGVQWMYAQLDFIVLYIVGVKLFLPVFMDLKLTSMYEYFERRFDSKLRRLASILFLLGHIFWMPIVIYVPALALNHATDINIHLITLITCGVCIFYTCVGGIRAVIWTDFLQAFLMIGSVLLVIIKGTHSVGGISIVIQRNIDGERLELPDMELSLTKRITFLTAIFGGSFGVVTASLTNQMMMQRYVSLPTLKHAGRAFGIFIILKTLFLLMCSYSGLLIYATYYNCDPLTAKIINRRDQVLPLLVIDTLLGVPGAAGLFLAGVFSASLSSLSSSLNCVAAVILEDCYKPLFKHAPSDKHCSIVVKSVVLILGIISILLTLIVGKLGTVLQLSATISSIYSGPILGLFILGILCPHIGTKGAFYGCVGSLCFMTVVVFGNQASIASGAIKYPTKNFTVDGCPFNVTLPETFITQTADLENSGGEAFILFRITFILYTFIGFAVTLLLAFIISFFTGFNNPNEINPMYLAPMIRKYFPSKKTDGNKYIFEKAQMLECTKIQSDGYIH